MPAGNGRSAVPTSKFQLSMSEMYHEGIAPGSGETHRAVCTIIEVYDQEKLLRGVVPSSVRVKAEKYPNTLYAKVKLQDGRYITRPFKETAAQVYSTYGNSLELETRPAVVEFYNSSVHKGKIIPIDNPFDIPAEMISAVETYDIGLLV